MKLFFQAKVSLQSLPPVRFLMLWIGPTWCVFTVWAVGSSAEGRKKETEGWRGGGSSEDSATMRNRWPCSFGYAASEHVRVCFLKTLLLTHLDDRSCVLAATTAALPGFFLLAVRLVFQSLFLPSPVRPSPSLSLGPSSGLHRGEREWDGVAVGPAGKQRFSPASTTSSRLSRVEPSCYETISWQAVFSLAHWIEARSHRL